MTPSRLLCIAAVLLIAATLHAQTDERPVDPRIWSQTYWQQLAEEGRIPVAADVPTAPATFTGSTIRSSQVLTDDSPDVPVTTANTTQSENSIFVHPLDNTKVLNSNNSTNFPVSTVLGTSGFMSGDAGLTWSGSINGTGGNNSGDPAAAIDLSGRYYVNYIAANGGNGTAHSTTEGATWTHVQVAPNPGQLADKNHMWVDNSPASPFEGNLYAAWTDFGGVNDGNVVVSRSTDGGLTWSPKVNVSSGLPGFHQGVNIQTGPNGEVYAVYAAYLSGGATDEPALGMSRSTDGGATWETPQLIITGIRGIRSSGTSKNMRSNSFPVAAVDISDSPRRGWVYVVWTNIGVPGVNQGPDIDVYMIRSTDSGATWSAPVRVNQDPAGQGKEHYLPWITCDPELGTLGVIFYDDRNVSSTQCEVFVATSLDGGDTWEDFKVSDVAFTPSPIPGLAGGYMGDYIAISSRGGKAYPCWTDNRTGRALTYVSPVLLLDPATPSDPLDLVAYSDYRTPDGMTLNWTDPVSRVVGDTLLSTDFRIHIARDGVVIDSVDGGVQQFTDAGLSDGQRYTYTISARAIGTDLFSGEVVTSWIAGGSPVPAPTDGFDLAGNTDTVRVVWRSPVANDDGTPIDDYAGIRLYQNGVAVADFSRAASDTGRLDSAAFAPATSGYYDWQIAAIDNEVPANESVPSEPLGTPLSLPFNDRFDQTGAPNASVWNSSGAEVNDRALNPPSGGQALNLNGAPTGSDTLDLKPLSLAGFAGQGVTLSYFYQPQGTGNAPEAGDSLLVYFKNSDGRWILVRGYPGSEVVDFQEEVIAIDSAPDSGATYFHGQFQVRFRNIGGRSNIPNDDWFIDDLVLSIPTAIDGPGDALATAFALHPNYPNPFNPVTTVGFTLPTAERVRLVVFDILGRRIATLAEGRYPAGTHRVQWDGTDQAGRPAASGVYFYRLEAGEFRATQKLMLLK